MDPRAQVRGWEETKKIAAAYRRVAAIAKNLPPAFQLGEGAAGVGFTYPPEGAVNSLIAECSKGHTEALGELKAAVVDACACAQATRVTWKFPQADGSVRDNENTYRFWSDELERTLADMEKVLGPLCENLKAYNNVCRLADELAEAVKKCPEPSYPEPTCSLYFPADQFHNARRDYLNHAQCRLGQATDDLIRAAESNADPNGMLSGFENWIDQAWEAVPQPAQSLTYALDDPGNVKRPPRAVERGNATPKPSSAKSKARKSRSKEPLADRVKTAMFGLHKDEKDYTTKAAVAERMGVSKSMLSKPEAAQAFDETLKLLSNAVEHKSETQRSSTQSRLQGRKLRSEIQGD